MVKYVIKLRLPGIEPGFKTDPLDDKQRTAELVADMSQMGYNVRLYSIGKNEKLRKIPDSKLIKLADGYKP